MMQPLNYSLLPQPLAGPQYRAVQPQYQYQGGSPLPLYPVPAPAYQYHPPAPARYQVMGGPPPQPRLANNNIPAFPIQPPPGFNLPPQSQPGMYGCPPPPAPPQPPPQVMMPAAPSLPPTDIPDLRHQ